MASRLRRDTDPYDDGLVLENVGMYNVRVCAIRNVDWRTVQCVGSAPEVDCFAPSPSPAQSSREFLKTSPLSDVEPEWKAVGIYVCVTAVCEDSNDIMSNKRAFEVCTTVY